MQKRRNLDKKREKLFIPFYGDAIGNSAWQTSVYAILAYYFSNYNVGKPPDLAHQNNSTREKTEPRITKRILTFDRSRTFLSRSNWFLKSSKGCRFSRTYNSFSTIKAVSGKFSSKATFLAVPDTHNKLVSALVIRSLSSLNLRFFFDLL